MIKNFSKQKKGFTLIEFIFYIALFSVFFVSLFFILDMSYKNKIKNRAVLEVEQQALFISQTIGQEIRNAQLINIPSESNSSSTLSLESFDLNRNPIIFYLSDNKIFLSENSNTHNISSDRVSLNNLNFENSSVVDGIQKVSFSFNLSYKSNSQKIEYQYDKDFFGEFNLNKK